MNTPTSPTTITRKGTFADLLAGHVQRKCHGYASLAYNAAWINRRTWSAIVTNPHRPVAKRTAIQFALALRLSRAETDELLRAAGYALSPSIIDDVIFASCIDDGVFNLFAVNHKRNRIRIIRCCIICRFPGFIKQRFKAFFGNCRFLQCLQQLLHFMKVSFF